MRKSSTFHLFLCGWLVCLEVCVARGADHIQVWEPPFVAPIDTSGPRSRCLPLNSGANFEQFVAIEF